MKNIVILGQSSGVYELAKSLRQANDTAEIVIFSLDGNYPHDPNSLPEYLAKKMSKTDLLCAEKSFYQEQRIQVITDETPERISLRQKKITTASKNHIKFDTLVIADAPEYRLSDVKGIQKQGVHHIRSLGAVEKFYQQLSFVKSVIIQINGFNDLRAAIGLKAWGAEVTVVVPYDTDMARLVEHDVCETIIRSFESETWKVYYGQSVAEVLGDSDLKAVRLSSGKVLAADVVIMGDAQPRLRLFEDFAGQDSPFISVNDRHEASVAHVFAFGDIAAPSYECVRYWNFSASDLKSQAQSLAQDISGQTSVASESPVLSYEAALEGWSIKVLGDVAPAINAMTYRQWNPETGVYQKMFTRDGKIRGAVLMNLPSTMVYQALIAEKTVVSCCEKFVFDQTLSLDQVKEILAHPPQVEEEKEPETFEMPAEETQNSSVAENS